MKLLIGGAGSTFHGDAGVWVDPSSGLVLRIDTGGAPRSFSDGLLGLMAGQRWELTDMHVGDVASAILTPPSDAIDGTNGTVLSSVRLGQPMPSIELSLVSGGTTTLSGTPGMPTAIYFWDRSCFGAGCSPVTVIQKLALRTRIDVVVNPMWSAKSNEIRRALAPVDVSVPVALDPDGLASSLTAGEFAGGSDTLLLLDQNGDLEGPTRVTTKRILRDILDAFAAGEPLPRAPAGAQAQLPLRGTPLARGERLKKRMLTLCASPANGKGLNLDVSSKTTSRPSTARSCRANDDGRQVRARRGKPMRLTLSVVVVSLAFTGCTSRTSASMSQPSAVVSGSGVRSDPGSDVSGDAGMQSGGAAPGYLDEVHGAITLESSGMIDFVDTLAAPLPAKPILPDGDVALGWSFCIDTKPRVSAPGFPMVSAMPCEFIVHTRWGGTELSGLLIDRRPLATGGTARKIGFEPIVEDSSIRMDVPFTSLGRPQKFHWSMFTEELGPFNTDIAYHVDEVPEGGVSAPVLWRAP